MGGAKTMGGANKWAAPQNGWRQNMDGAKTRTAPNNGRRQNMGGAKKWTAPKNGLLASVLDSCILYLPMLCPVFVPRLLLLGVSSVLQQLQPPCAACLDQAQGAVLVGSVDFPRGALQGAARLDFGYDPWNGSLVEQDLLKVCTCQDFDMLCNRDGSKSGSVGF